jgi:hypothetical protein
MKKKAKKRATKYEKKIVVPDGMGFEDLIKLSVKEKKEASPKPKKA